MGRNAAGFDNATYGNANSNVGLNSNACDFGQNANVANVCEIDRIISGDFLQILTLSGPNAECQDDLQVQTWGTPWEPEEFVQMAVAAGHPSAMRSFLPQTLTECIDRVVRTPVQERVMYRATALKRWMRRSLELRQDEKDFAAKLHPSVSEVLNGKKLLLWKEMLESINYSDIGVCAEFFNGTYLTGQTQRTGLWPAKVTPATMTEGDLMEQARLQRASLTYEQVVFFDDQIAMAVWSQTLEEVAKGEAEGPFSLESIPAEYPLSRRFGVQQSGKIRCVDDFTWSGIYGASQTLESPKPHTVDVIAAMVMALMRASDKSETWLARSFDLKSAYRQCAIHPESAKFSYIVVGDPSEKILKVFRLKALPFGSVKSVHSFLRMSHSLWAILAEIFMVPTTNYFDDYVALASTGEARSVDHTVKSVFKLLGWKFAEDGPKAPPFNAKLNALGVCLDVTNLHVGTVSVDNTESRRTELAGLIGGILHAKELKRLEALKLRGRMQFASGQIFGRASKKSLSVVTHHAYHAETPKLSSSAISALTRFRDMLTSSTPRCISTSKSGTWFLFTDASYEPVGDGQRAGIGAVLVDQVGVQQRFLSQELSLDLLQKINVSQRKTTIFECEFFAVLCALHIWSDTLHAADVVLHTDDDGVRDCFISCHTDSANAQKILDACIKVEDESRSNIWITRVPTESNVADDPSRMCTNKLIQCGCKQDFVQCERVWNEIVLETGQSRKRGRHETSTSSPSPKRALHQCEGHRAVT